MNRRLLTLWTQAGPQEQGAMLTICPPHMNPILTVSVTPARSPRSSDLIATPCTCGESDTGRTARRRIWWLGRECQLVPAAYSSSRRSSSIAHSHATTPVPPEKNSRKIWAGSVTCSRLISVSCGVLGVDLAKMLISVGSCDQHLRILSYLCVHLCLNITFSQIFSTLFRGIISGDSVVMCLRVWMWSYLRCVSAASCIHAFCFILSDYYMHTPSVSQCLLILLCVYVCRMTSLPKRSLILAPRLKILRGTTQLPSTHNAQKTRSEVSTGPSERVHSHTHKLLLFIMPRLIFVFWFF